MKAIGRPPLPVGDGMTEMIAVRLTQGERLAIERAATAAGMGVSEWARMVLIQAATAVPANDKKRMPNVWICNTDSGTIYIETPDPLPRKIWEVLVKYVEILKPDDVSRWPGTVVFNEGRE